MPAKPIAPLVAALCLAGCGGVSATSTDLAAATPDAATRSDASTRAVDGATPPDGAVAADLATPSDLAAPPDLAPPADLTAAPTCSDGVRNGTETDVDCGGATCPKCAFGSACTQARDCQTAKCASSRCALITSVSFGAPHVYALGFGASTNALATGDVDHDGKDDVAVACTSAMMLISDGSGGFSSAVPLTGGGSYPLGPTVADVDGDGKLDVVTADANQSFLALYRGKGNGLFYPAQQLATDGWGEVTAVGDVDGDGRPDVVEAIQNGVDLFLGSASGLGAATRFSTDTAASYLPSGAVLRDFNGDARADIATADYVAIGTALSTGSGFASPHDVGGSTENGLVAADLNVDGRVDLVSSRPGANQIATWIGDGSGGFSLQHTYATGRNPEWLATADVNVDGVPDILVTAHDDQLVDVFVGTGNGDLQAPIAVPIGAAPNSIATGDLDGDGRPDLVVGVFLDKTLHVLLNTSQ